MTSSSCFISYHISVSKIPNLSNPSLELCVLQYMMNAKILYIFILTVTLTDSYNILVFFPFIASSHFLLYKPLFNELASRGHNLTVVSHFPQERKIPNYRDVSLGNGDRKIREFVSMEAYANLSHSKWAKTLFAYQQYYDMTCSKGFENEALSKFFRENNEFDLVLVEYFMTECFMNNVKKFNAPYIGKYILLFDNYTSPGNRTHKYIL